MVRHTCNLWDSQNHKFKASLPYTAYSRLARLHSMDGDHFFLTQFEGSGKCRLGSRSSHQATLNEKLGRKGRLGRDTRDEDPAVSLPCLSLWVTLLCVSN